MNWQDQSITSYLMVCKHYESHLWVYCQRMSNHTDLGFSDEEAITLYLFGVIEKNREIRQIYTYANRHLQQWFPKLPGYVAFVQRLNRLSDVFVPLLEIIQSEQEANQPHSALLVDSFPVALTKQGHRFKTCVAKVYGDKVYHRPDAQEIQEQFGLTVFTPVKKQKGQSCLEAEQQWLYQQPSHEFVSRLRPCLAGLKKKGAIVKSGVQGFHQAGFLSDSVTSCQ